MTSYDTYNANRKKFPDQHLAADIFDSWQKGFSKGWKWNNLHRHLYSNDSTPREVYVNFQGNKPAPIHDNRNIPQFRTPWISPMFTGSARQAIYKLRAVRKRRASAERIRLENKKRWIKRNVEGPLSVYNDRYDDYRYCIKLEKAGETGTWFYFARNLGLTFRHLRGECGYNKYFNSNYEEQFDVIDLTAAQQYRETFNGTRAGSLGYRNGELCIITNETSQIQVGHSWRKDIIWNPDRVWKDGLKGMYEIIDFHDGTVDINKLYIHWSWDLLDHPIAYNGQP